MLLLGLKSDSILGLLINKFLKKRVLNVEKSCEMLCIYKKKDPTDRGQAALLAQDNKTPQTRPLPPHALPAMASHPEKKSVFFGHYQFRLDPPPTPARNLFKT